MTIAGASVCLDTDVCVDLLRRRRGFESLPLAGVPRGHVWLSAVTVAELSYGMSRSRHREEESERLARLLEIFDMREFGASAAHTAGYVRAQLDARGQRIGVMDALIGAHALAEGAALMTRNVREFSRIEGLVIAEV